MLTQSDTYYSLDIEEKNFRGNETVFFSPEQTKFQLGALRVESFSFKDPETNITYGPESVDKLVEFKAQFKGMD